MDIENEKYLLVGRHTPYSHYNGKKHIKYFCIKLSSLFLIHFLHIRSVCGYRWWCYGVVVVVVVVVGQLVTLLLAHCFLAGSWPLPASE